MFIVPKFYAFDTSQWVGIIDDALSESTERRRKSEQFLAELDRRSILPVLSWHHVEELMSHENEEKAYKRIEFLISINSIAWVKCFHKDIMPGSIVDILTAEVKAVLSKSEAELEDIPSISKSDLIQYGSGRDVLGKVLEGWVSIRDQAMILNYRAREIISISRAEYSRIGNTKLASWLDRELKSPEEVIQDFSILHKLLKSDIEKHGDNRIIDANSVSAEFFARVKSLAPELLNGNHSPAMNVIFNVGLDLNDVNPDMTIDEIGRLAKFYKNLRNVHQNLAINKYFIEWDDLKGLIIPYTIPSFVIETVLVKHRQRDLKKRGSDLNDGHLLCLSPYVDATFADKRTYENYRRASQKSETFSKIIGNVQKVSKYDEIKFE